MILPLLTVVSVLMLIPGMAIAIVNFFGYIRELESIKQILLAMGLGLSVPVFLINGPVWLGIANVVVSLLNFHAFFTESAEPFAAERV